jgi:hypothetical protein
VRRSVAAGAAAAQQKLGGKEPGERNQRRHPVAERLDQGAPPRKVPNTVASALLVARRPIAAPSPIGVSRAASPVPDTLSTGQASTTMTNPSIAGAAPPQRGITKSAASTAKPVMRSATPSRSTSRGP